MIEIESEESAPMGASAMSGTAQRTLSKDAKGVFVPMTHERLQRLDEDRETLGMSRGGALAVIYDGLGGDTLDAAQQRGAEAAAQAESIASVISPLVDALDKLARAWGERAHQRRMIGTHTNQVAKLANALALQLHDHSAIDRETVESLVLALQGIERTLGEQQAAESADDRIVAAVRSLGEQAQVPR